MPHSICVETQKGQRARPVWGVLCCSFRTLVRFSCPIVAKALGISPSNPGHPKHAHSLNKVSFKMHPSPFQLIQGSLGWNPHSSAGLVAAFWSSQLKQLTEIFSSFFQGPATPSYEILFQDLS